MTQTTNLPTIQTATFRELESLLFLGQSPTAPRAWSDAYSLDELCAIATRDDFAGFPSYAQNAIHSSIDRLAAEESARIEQAIAAEKVRDQHARERAMFGSTATDIDALVKHAAERPYGTEPIDFAISLLSDAQEQIEIGHAERARKTINVAKYILDQISRAPKGGAL